MISTEQLTEATEEEYALWQMEAVVSSEKGESLEGCSITLNGTPLTVHTQEDGTLLIRASYEDQSYRPVDYYGDDVGLIYDYEKYIAAYPEVAEECEFDEEAVMDYFFEVKVLCIFLILRLLFQARQRAGQERGRAWLLFCLRRQG